MANTSPEITVESLRKKNTIKNSIKFKLVVSFGVVIVIWLAQMMYLASLHLKIVEDYKSVTDNLVLENSLSSLTPEFIQSYFNVVNSPGNNERIAQYNELHKDMEGVLTKLDKTISNKDSRVTFKGLSNYIQSIITTCDEGMEDIKAGRVIQSIQKYDEIIVKSRFINENVGNLVVKELNYAGELQVEIDKTHTRILQQGLGLILGITLFCILFAIFLANRIINPLISLSAVANLITKGHLKVKVDEKLLSKEDETGILSKSFASMLKRLNEEIETQKKIAMDLEKSRNKLEESNEALENFNRLAVGRELKMIEMKEELKQIRATSSAIPLSKKYKLTK